MRKSFPPFGVIGQYTGEVAGLFAANINFDDP